jgi:hypothetical protein
VGADFLRLPVRLRGIELGRPVDLLLDGDGRRVVALEVSCGDDAVRFLPLGAARIGDGEIAVESAFTVIDDTGFYRTRGRTLTEIRGEAVESGGVAIGTIEDVVVDAYGSVCELVLEAGRRVPFDQRVQIAARGRTAA